MAPANAYAAEGELATAYVDDGGFYIDEGTSGLGALSEPDVTGLQQVIEQGLRNDAEKIDVESYGYVYDIENDVIPTELKNIFYRAVKDCPDLFYLKTSFSISYYDNGLIASVSPVYVDSLKNDENKAEYEAAMAKLLATVPAGATDLAKIKAVHDYLYSTVTYCGWCPRHTGADKHEECYTAWGTIVEGRGVCQSYSLAFEDALNRLGVTSICVDSSEMNHMWNMVRVAGNWYQVDCTWDDPVVSYDEETGVTTDLGPDIDAEYTYRFFMKSSTWFEGYTEHPHYGWYPTDYEATSTLYDSADSINGHAFNLVKTDAKAATCTEAGNTAYYTCTKCNTLFSDEAAQEPVTLAGTVIAASGHSIAPVAAKAATCTEPGNTAYYTCTECSSLFSDEGAQIPTTLSGTVVPATGHAFANYVYNNNATFTANGTETAVCANGCGATQTRQAAGTKVAKPQAVKLSSVKSAAKKKLTVTWKKAAAANQVTGYQLRYSLKSNMSKAKTVTVKGASSAKKILKSLKSKKKYYVQVRTYKKVGSATAYSSWSAKKSAKVK